MIFKEVYNNILKHAKASKVNVQLHLNEVNELEIVVSDNGKGFNADIQQKGNGIKNIKNRVDRMNGELIIQSTPGEGTRMNILLKNLFI
jgi:signal transduction histidine kinase